MPPGVSRKKKAPATAAAAKSRSTKAPQQQKRKVAPAAKPAKAASTEAPRALAKRHVRVGYTEGAPPSASAGRLLEAGGPIRRGALVLVYMPGCGYCERMRDAWEQAAAQVTRSGDSNVVEVDSRVVDQAGPSQPLVQAITGPAFRGVPHIVYVTATRRTLYDGDRSAASLVSFARRAAAASRGA